MSTLTLLPRPRSLTPASGSYPLVSGRRIVLDVDQSQDLLATGARLQAALRQYASVEWELAASAAGPAEEIGALLRIAPDVVPHREGYTLQISPSGILIEARGPAGIFYAVATLTQILAQAAGRLPCLTIADWPDFAARGVMLDISRDKVPSLETVLMLVEMLASWKINQLQLYTEHTFAYRNHPEVWAEASPFTGEEILRLDAFCRERFVELVPNQNTFGHMERWLKHQRYADLAEAPEGFTDPWGNWRPYAFSLNPGDPASLDLVRSLFDELLPHFSSRLFNVGCDETFDLGQGKSSEACAAQGSGRVYLDFLQKIYAEVSARGYTMQFWGDIIIQHPELIAELPKDAIALEWGYEADHPFAEHVPQFAAAQIPFYVCPGTSSWCSLAGRTENAVGNLRSAALYGRRHGAVGLLNTDWGDLGHWQFLPISFLGFAQGAASAWAEEQNAALDLPQTLNRLVFGDSAGVIGQVAYDLGNIYRLLPPVGNASLLFWLLQLPLAELAALRAEPESPRGQLYAGLTPQLLRDVISQIDVVAAPLQQARIQRPDADVIVAEFAAAARLMRHACRRGLLLFEDDAALRAELARDMQQIIDEYRRLWLARNRPGGLVDSVARLEQAAADYQVKA